MREPDGNSYTRDGAGRLWWWLNAWLRLLEGTTIASNLSDRKKQVLTSHVSKKSKSGLSMILWPSHHLYHIVTKMISGEKCKCKWLEKVLSLLGKTELSLCIFKLWPEILIKKLIFILNANKWLLKLNIR